MKKIEVIWREMLFQAIEKNKVEFNQSTLAEKFGFSTSTVSAALSQIRQMGIVKVQKKFFRLVNVEKLLFFWATKRQLNRELIYKTRVDLPIMEIEGLLPGSIIPAAYMAYRFRYKSSPSDYDHVYVYGTKNEVEKRFPQKSGYPNLFVLKPDEFLKNYKTLPLSQIFVDLWNLPEWYSRDFYQELLTKIT